jgi:hypothetical protein
MNALIGNLASALVVLISASGCAAKTGSSEPVQERVRSQVGGSPVVCELDACGRGTPLKGGATWSAFVLKVAGLEYVNEYRDDGGGGHVVPAWNLMISALAPEDDPSGWALAHEYRPFWKSDGITVFGSVKDSSPIGYFYWHAGGVDSAVQVGWDSEISKPHDLSKVIGQIIVEQTRSPFTDAGPDSESPPLPDGWTTHRDDELKFSASYPTEWDRATSALTDLANPHELFVLGSGRLEPGGECAPTASINAMGADDVLIYLLEDGKGPAGDESSRPRNFAFSEGAREPMECVGDPAQADVYSFLFTDSGRAFDATVIVGSASEVSKRNDLLQVLDRLHFFSLAGS